jgi:hypothetical protein
VAGEGEVEAARIDPGSNQIVCPIVKNDIGEVDVVREIILESTHLHEVSFTD